MSKFMIERVVINTTTIGGMVNSQFDPGIELNVTSGSNLLAPSLRVITQILSSHQFSTLDCKTLLDLMFANTVPHIAVTGAATLKVYIQITDGATRGAGSANIILTSTKGIITPTSLSSAGGLAVLGFRFDGAFDGTNIPVTRSDANQALVAATAAPVSLWRLHAVQEDDGTPVVITNIQPDWAINFGINVSSDVPSTQVYPAQTVITGFAPTGEFGTTAAKVLLDLTGMSAAVVGGTPATDGHGLQFFLTPVGTDGVFTLAGSIYVSFRAGSPYVIQPIDLSAKPIVVRATVMGLYGADLTEPPLIYAIAETAPSGTETDEAYMQGPASDASLITEPTGGQVDLGLAIEMITPGHLLGPNAWNIREQAPKIRIDTRDVEDLKLGTDGQGRTIATAFTCYLRHIGTDGEPVIDATAEHIKFSILDGHIHPLPYGGAHGSEAEGAMMVTAEDSDGLQTGTAIMVISTASAIT